MSLYAADGDSFSDSDTGRYVMQGTRVNVKEKDGIVVDEHNACDYT